MRRLLLELDRIKGNQICPFSAQITIALVAIVLGTFLILRPKKVIDIQIALYRPFNWKLEPISMTKAVGRMRFMGTLLLALGVCLLIYIAI